MTSETKLSKVIGVTVALVCLIPLGICDVVVFLWQALVVPVIEQFAELGRDLKTIMKGEG